MFAKQQTLGKVVLYIVPMALFVNVCLSLQDFETKLMHANQDKITLETQLHDLTQVRALSVLSHFTYTIHYTYTIHLLM